MMELYIETLTGAAFELRVSPFETIMAVKAKIQRLEGIPINQQHLIWQTVELDDDYCLHDYDIHNGATLKLVLAMRGGPINTRRVPIDDSSILEYVESTPDEAIDKASSRQVTLLVFREGDQLNFFRVVDRGDGTLTPLSESLSAASVYNMYDEEEDSEGGNKEKNEENARIKEKINSLKNKMDNMSVSKKTRKMEPTPPTQARTSDSARLQAIRSAQTKPVSGLNRNRCLPPVSQKVTMSGDHDYVKPLSAQSNSKAQLSELSIPKPPADTCTSKHDISQHLHAQITVNDLPTSSGINKSYSARSQRHSDSDYKYSGHHGTESRIRCIPEDETVASDPLQSSATSLKAPPFSKRKDNMSLDKLKESYRGHSALSDVSLTPHLKRSSRQSELRTSSRQHADLTLETLKDSFCSQRITLESLSSNEAKMMSGLLQQASLERLGCSSISNFSPVRTQKGASGYNRLNLDENGRILEKAMSASHPTIDSLENIGSSSAKLPPVKSKKKANKTKRCFICAKKTGLATSYICRCGNNFCATHRYAEMHDCTFDYKTEGRQLLEQNNPVVSAPKLPKI